MALLEVKNLSVGYQTKKGFLKAVEGVSFSLNEGEDIDLVDSIPIPICQIAREKSCEICQEDYETAPDKAYISESIQLDLFNTRQIRLQTPLRSNQHDKELFPFIFKKSRNRI